MSHAAFIKTDGTTIEVKPAGDTFTLGELQTLVGGLIEILNLPSGQILVINEEGKLRDMEVNPIATIIFITWFGNIDVVVGDVLLCDSDLVD